MTTAHMPSDDAIPVDSLGIDAFEIGLLSILRHFMTAFARPESQAWQSAFSIAAERWGGTRGPKIAQGLLAVIQVLRQARRTDFHYANPLCLQCREMATGEEAALCLMLHAMRRDRPDLARGAVMDLTDGVMDASLIQSALAFCARFPAEPEPVHAPARRAEPVLPRPTGRHLRLVH